MLTDYHVHLRPDEDGTDAASYFTPENAERYREAAGERGIAELGVSEHVHRFAQALEVWGHPFWRRWAVDDLDAYCAFVREETDLKLGLEADFVPGREDRMANLLDGRDWDYVLGSVHFLSEESVDMRGDWDIWRSGDPDRVWRRYFETVAEAARSGLYDVIAHPDLVKVWGDGAPRPDGDLQRFYEPAVEAIAESGVAVEVSTAGLRKPVAEIYPARGFLELCLEAGAPVALSSDAHRPEQLGHEYDRALELLSDVGVGEVCVFERRARTLEQLGTRTASRRGGASCWAGSRSRTPTAASPGTPTPTSSRTR
jgi:histidinol-phosphatase (PHP family)